MKRALPAALIAIIVVVALIIIIPMVGGIDHKDVSTEASQENFIDYAVDYETFANENSLEFEASTAAVVSTGSYSQTYTLEADNYKVSVAVSNTDGYEIVEVSYGAHYDDEGSLQSVDDEVLSTMVSAYNLIGAVEIAKDDVLKVIEDADEEDDYYLYGYERIEKCGDYPTYISYASDNPQSEELRISGITEYCMK